MKTKTRKYIGRVVAVVATAVTVSAFGALLVEYQFSGTNPLAPTTVAANITAQNLAIGPGARDQGVSGGGYAADLMNSSSLDLNDYFEVGLQPNPGYTIDLTSFVFTYWKAHSNSPNYWAVRYSVDGFASNLSSGTQSTTPQTATISLSDTGLTGSVRFRIYGWGAASSDRDMVIDDVQIHGAVIPEPGTLGLLLVSAILSRIRRALQATRT